MNAYSHSTLELHGQCPRALAYRRAKKPADFSEPMTSGIVAHQLIEAYVRRCREKGLMNDPESIPELLMTARARDGQPLPGALLADVEIVLRNFASFYVVEQIDEWRVFYEAELAFDMAWAPCAWDAWDRVRYRAKLDMVEEVDGTTRITDWKTGHYVPPKDEEERSPQLLRYAFVWSLRAPATEVFDLRIVYARQRFERRHKITREEIEKVRPDLEARMRAADEDRVGPMRTGPHCERCDYRRFCPGYLDAGRLDTTPQGDADLAAAYYLAKARAADLETALKERIKSGPIALPDGRRVGLGRRESLSCKDPRGTLADLIEAGVPADVIYPKVGISKTNLAALLKRIDREDLLEPILRRRYAASVSTPVAIQKGEVGNG